MHFILSFFAMSLTATAQSEFSFLRERFADVIRMGSTAAPAAWASFEPTFVNDPPHFAAALAAIVADVRAYEKDENRPRLFRLLVDQAEHVDHWPTTWRRKYGGGMHDALDRLLRNYQVRHAQIERVTDLFDRLDLWSQDQADWLIDTYLNKSWPRLVTPLLRALRGAPAELQEVIREAVVGGKRPMKTTFITRAISYRYDPPETPLAIYRLLTAYPEDATDQVLASARRGFRTMVEHAPYEPKYAERYRYEVNGLFRETFEKLRARYREGGRDNEVVAAMVKARRGTLGAMGRKTPEQHAVFDELLDLVEGRGGFEALVDVGVRFTDCIDALATTSPCSGTPSCRSGP